MAKQTMKSNLVVPIAAPSLLCNRILLTLQPRNFARSRTITGFQVSDTKVCVYVYTIAFRVVIFVSQHGFCIDDLLKSFCPLRALTQEMRSC
eukprot:1139273-Pelagomonas_calceolata.AAC.5